MKPLISVIIPAYNVADYLSRCLDSLLVQSWKELELIVVDDGSTDGTSGLADDYTLRDSRVRVIHQANGGVSSARNAGLAASRGELIGFTDGDDWVKPDYLESLAETLLRQNAEMAVCGYVEELPVPGAAPLIRGTHPQQPCGPAQAAELFLKREGWFTALWNKLFTRESLLVDDGFLLFNPALAVGEDETWLLRLLPGLHRIAFCPKALYVWTSRLESASRSEGVTPRSMTVLKAKQMAIELTQPFGSSLQALARSRCLNDCYHLKVFAYRSHDRKTLKLLSRAFRPVRFSWLCSRDVPLLRKAKVLCMDLLIILHAPAGLVDRAFYARRQHG